MHTKQAITLFISLLLMVSVQGAMIVFSEVEKEVQQEQTPTKQAPKTRAPKPEVKPRKEKDLADDVKRNLWKAVKEMVTEKLVSPVTADFHDGLWEGKQGPDNNVNVQEDVYTVDGYVDSQNSFGAMLRTEFSIKARLDNRGALLELIQPLDFNHELEQQAIRAKKKELVKSIEDEWKLKEIVWLDTTTKVIKQLEAEKRYTPRVDRFNLQTGLGYEEQGRDYVTLKDGIYTVNGYADVTKDLRNLREPGARYHYMFSRKVRFDNHWKLVEVEPLTIR